MNWLELGRIDLIGWYLFVVDGGRELPELTCDLDENVAELKLAYNWTRELAVKPQETSPSSGCA